MSEKKYLRGSAKEAPFSENGEFINFSLKVEEVANLADGEWINLAIRRKREVDQYGNTHSVFLNEYKKDKDKGSSPKSKDPITEAFGKSDNPFE